jgi:hypothetical protein
MLDPRQGGLQQGTKSVPKSKPKIVGKEFNSQENQRPNVKEIPLQGNERESYPIHLTVDMKYRYRKRAIRL